MLFRYRKNIAHFLDISVIIPLRESWAGFINALEVNQQYLRRNGLEVILLVQDEQFILAALTLPASYTAINWKIVLYTQPEHDQNNWLNTGLAYASCRYVLLLPATVILKTDVVYQLRYFTYHYKDSFAVTPNGFCLLAERVALMDIEDGSNNSNVPDTIKHCCLQLQMISKNQMVVPEALTAPGIVEPAEISNAPENTQADNNHLLFNWATDKPEANIPRVLSQFTEHVIHNPDIFQKEYRLICLIQVRNEIKHLPEVLLHLDKHCDGIILLDDGSDDGSWENAFSEKLLIKVRKNYKGFFDDLENRNLLLQLGNLFKTQWFFFTDADERIDSRYANLTDICQQPGIDSVSFNMVHLWNHPGSYLKDLPEGKNGLFRRYRMFKNFGYMQIESAREIHFAAIPYKKQRYHAPVLVLHAGIMDAQNRKSKYTNYTQADEEGKKQGYPYEFLLVENASVGNVTDIKLTQ